MLTSEQQQQTTTAGNNKSPEINLFQRGLSVFLDPFPTTLDPAKSDIPQTTHLDLNNSEKTYDLADYLYNQTSTSTKPTVTTTTTLTQLEPVRPATPVQQQQQQQQMVVNHNLIHLNECSMDSLSSSSSKELVVRSTATKRGRKPASATSVQPKKFAKFVDDNTTKTLVYFGNKKVEVGTDEYDKRRKNNNEAVKKCRQKMEQEQKEREAKMQTLVDENRRLNEKVNTMTKEMEVLKGIIISMKPDNALPEFIQKPLNDL